MPDSAESTLAATQLQNAQPGPCFQRIASGLPSDPPADAGRASMAYFIDTANSQVEVYFWDIGNQVWVAVAPLAFPGA